MDGEFKRYPLTVRFTAEGWRLLAVLAQYYGLSKNGTLEMLLRRVARDEQVYDERLVAPDVAATADAPNFP
jgi:hypothetical protein